jgi:hypothetical protein
MLQSLNAAEAGGAAWSAKGTAKAANSIKFFIDITLVVDGLSNNFPFSGVHGPFVGTHNG